MTEQIIKQEEIHSPSIYFENECFEEDDYCTYCIQSPEHQHQHHHQHSSHQQPIQKDFMPTFYNPFETKHRRRTSRAQFKILETSFYENAKPNATMRRWLAHKLGMTPRSVQVWFQNRRAKAKSQLKKHINAASSSSSSSSPSLLSSSPSSSSFIPSPHPLMIPTDSSSSFYSPMMMPMESPTFDQEWPTSMSSSSSPDLITPTIPMNDDDYYTLTPPMLSTSSPSSCSSSYDPSQWQYHHQHHPSSSHLDDPLSIMTMYPYPSPTTTLSSSPANIMHQQHPSIDQQRRTSYPIDPSNFDKDDVRRLSEPIFHQPIPSTTSDYLLMDHQTIPLNMVDTNNICFM